jgi:mannosyltransferase
MRIGALDTASHETRVRHYLPLAVAMLLAAAIRIAAIHFSLWYDETAAIKFAEQPISLLWSDWAARETNPPLYYSLLHFWIMVVGEGDVAVKALSLTIGMVSIFLIYRAAMILTGAQSAAFIAAILAAVSEPHVHFSLEARGYILAYAGALIAVSGIIQLWRRYEITADPDFRWPLLQYVLGSTIAVYSHTTQILYVGFANLFMIGLFACHWQRLRSLFPWWILANGVLAAIWIWWGDITVHQAGGHNPNITWLATPTVFDAIKAWQLTFLPYRFYPVPLVFELLTLGTFAYAAWRGCFRTASLTMLGCALMVPVGMFLISQKMPVYMPKTLFAATGLFTLALATAMATLPFWPRVIVFSLLLLGAAHQLSAELPRREYDRWDVAAADLLAANAPRRIFVADEGVAIAIDHYCRRIGHSACPLDIEIVEARRDWSYGLSGHPRITAAQALVLAAQADYATFTWSAPRDQLDYLAVRPDMTKRATRLGRLGWLVYWHHKTRS